MHPKTLLTETSSSKSPEKTDLEWMDIALQTATRALEHEDVPIGAIVVDATGQMIGVGWNVRERDQDPCGHAEIMALRAASQHQQRWRLDGCTVYVTLEPCAMCAGAMVLSRIARCVWAAPDPKGGYLGTLGNLAADSRLNHQFEVQGGLQQEASAEMLRAFFKRLRQRKR